MPGELHEFLSDDHARLEALLTAALRPDGTIDEESYVEFRRGLLRHISMEERVLMPEVRRRRGDSEVERQLHRDHAALAALLVPPPTARDSTRFARSSTRTTLWKKGRVASTR